MRNDNELESFVKKTHEQTMEGRLVWHETVTEGVFIAVLEDYTVRIARDLEGDSPLALCLNEGSTEVLHVTEDMDLEMESPSLAALLEEIWEAADSGKAHMVRAREALEALAA